MAHQHSTPHPQRTQLLEADSDSDMDSGVGDEAGEDSESPVTDEDSVSEQDNAEEHGRTQQENTAGGEFTVFVAFKGNMEDEDFAKKLEAVLSGIPNVLDMGQTLVLHSFLTTSVYFSLKHGENFLVSCNLNIPFC